MQYTLVKVENKNITDKRLYTNTARAFNYVLGCVLRYYFNSGLLPLGRELRLQVDQRNTKTQSINSLEDYLNILLSIQNRYVENVLVEYFQSHNNTYIQIADLFSNLYFSYHHNPKGYKDLFDELKKDDYVNVDFKFPIR